MPISVVAGLMGVRSATISAAALRTLAGSDKSHTTETACCPFCSMVFLHLVELSAVAADQDDRAVLGQLKCGAATYAGGRAGNDLSLAICRIFQNRIQHILDHQS